MIFESCHVASGQLFQWKGSVQVPEAIVLKHALMPAEPEDGFRILLKSLPATEAAACDAWCAELGTELSEAALDMNVHAWECFSRVRRALKTGRVSLLYWSDDQARMDAEVLKRWLCRRLECDAAKQRLRSQVREELLHLPEAYMRYADAQITERLLESREYRGAERLFVYVSMPREPDTHVLITHALESGKRVYVPRCLPAQRMEGVRLLSMHDLVPGRYSIPEPRVCSETAEASEVDMVIVPCMSVTRDGKRLGHGGGYYDRYLAHSETFRVCLCYARLLQTEIPVNVLDCPMHAILTEEGMLYCQRI